MIINNFPLQFVTIFLLIFLGTCLILQTLKRNTNPMPKEASNMSNYTPKMEAELRAKEVWTYADCEAFAAQHSEISTRSVISKVKNMGLEYKPQPKAAKTAKGDQIRKSDMVKGIAAALSVNYDAIAGLAKADKRALTELQKALDSQGATD